MSAKDIWIKDLDALESAWNEFLESNSNDDQQSHNNNNGKHGIDDDESDELSASTSEGS